MSSNAVFKFWLGNDYFDEQTREELQKIKDDAKEVEDRFYKYLDFGTGGLRGIIGAGTNRINIYTVRRASQGLADFVNSIDAAQKGIVIAYDSRNMSPEFALESAKVFAGNGIKAYLFDELRPTPELSFAVRYFKAAAGIVITASHNPKEYNGYKVYGEDGGQLPLEESNKVLGFMDKIEDITSVTFMEKDEAIEKGLIKIIGKEVDDAYISMLKGLSVNPDLAKSIGENFKIVYTPLHGSGNKPVRRILDEIGFRNVLVVKEQELPDKEFSTIKSPNPEEKEAFTLAIELARNENVDLIIGTDPDSDRVGVVVRNKEGEYVTLSGNQTGCLLLEYILSQKKAKGTLPANGFVVKTIVTTELSREIAREYGVELIEVLTGFKFIGEQIKLLDENGDKKFLFGFEESYGYLAGTSVRDKDAVVASMLIAEMAAYYKSRDMSLYDGLMELLNKYGYTIEGIKSYTLKGKEGLDKIKYALSKMREDKITKFGGVEVAAVRDYQKGERHEITSRKREIIDLPESDVLYYEMQDGKSWFCIRPSGTEPKIKIYYGVTGNGMEAAVNKLDQVQSNVLGVVENLLFE